MPRPFQGTDPRQWFGLSDVPLAVGVIAVSCWLFAAAGLYVDGNWGSGVMLNPFNYLLSMVLHFNWGHFASNMWWWLPIGIVFTALTSNRHLLLIALGSHLLTQVVSNGLFRFVSGLSVAVFAVLTATLVRSIGIAFQNRSMEALQTALAVLVVPVLIGVFLIVIVAGPSQVGHLEHFLGALFGAAMEAMYVLGNHGDSDTESTASTGFHP